MREEKRRIYEAPVCPFVESDNLPALLVCWRLGGSRPWWSLRSLSGPVQEGDSVQPRHLAPPHVRTLEVSVQHHVEVEGRLLAGVVDTDVEVEFLLSEDDPVGNFEVVLPHGEGKVTVTQGEYCFNITTGHPVRTFLQLPATNSSKSVIRGAIEAVVPLAKLWKDKGYSASDGLPSIKHGFLADKKLLLKCLP